MGQLLPAVRGRWLLYTTHLPVVCPLLAAVLGVVRLLACPAGASGAGCTAAWPPRSSCPAAATLGRPLAVGSSPTLPGTSGRACSPCSSCRAWLHRGSELSWKPCLAELEALTPVCLLLQSRNGRLLSELQQGSIATVSCAAGGAGAAAGERGRGLSAEQRRALQLEWDPSSRVASQVSTGVPAKQQLSVVHRPVPGVMCVLGGEALSVRICNGGAAL